jgi:alcohol dehydrogenase
VHGEAAIDTAPLIVNEITLVGSRCGRFEPALELLRRGVIDVTSMITEIMPLEHAPKAFEKAAQPGALKILLASRGS